MFTCLKEPLLRSSRSNSFRSSGQDREEPSAHGTNQIAGFGEFRPLANLGKNIKYIFSLKKDKHDGGLLI